MKIKLNNMEWNNIFKLLGPKSKSIREIPHGYSIVMKDRTIFQFKDFSGEFNSVDLFNDHMILYGDTEVKYVFKPDWDSLKVYNL